MDSIDVHIQAGEPQTAPEDPLRKQLHKMWSAVAGGWDENADFIESLRSPVAEAMLAFSHPQPGERVLELACGPGGAGFLAAPLLGDAGGVVMSDFSAEMVAIARRRAQEHGLENVRSRVIDLEQIDEPDDSFDIVYCREGLMLVPDPKRGASEIARVLQHGGRMAVSVWGPRERNPWLGMMFDAVSEEMGAPIPPPGIPQPFALDSPEKFGEVFGGAGFAELEIRELEIMHSVASFDEWWDRTTAIAGPLAQVLAALPPEKTESIRDRSRMSLQQYETASGFEMPSVTQLATARVT